MQRFSQSLLLPLSLAGVCFATGSSALSAASRLPAAEENAGPIAPKLGNAMADAIHGAGREPPRELRRPVEPHRAAGLATARSAAAALPTSPRRSFLKLADDQQNSRKFWRKGSPQEGQPAPPKQQVDTGEGMAWYALGSFGGIMLLFLAVFCCYFAAGHMRGGSSARSEPAAGPLPRAEREQRAAAAASAAEARLAPSIRPNSATPKAAEKAAAAPATAASTAAAAAPEQTASNAPAATAQASEQ